MKKYLSIFCAIALMLCLGACGNSPEKNQTVSIFQNTQQEDKNGNAVSDTGATAMEVQNSGSLTVLASGDYAYFNTEDGYYYITEEEIALKDGGYATHLMYMDFATQQEIYLCSDAGCSHDDESCTAVLCEDEFEWGSSKIFVWNGSLYILSKEYDSDGSTVIEFSIGEAPEVETAPATLYRMNLDGTDRKKIYTFADGVTLEDCIFADDDGIYFITKKLETSVDGNTTITSSTDRNLVRYTPAGAKLETVVSMNFDDSITWQAVGCFDNSLVLEGIFYADGSDASANMSQDEWKEIYNKSKSVFATLDLSNGELTQVYQIQNSGIHSSATRAGFLYVSEESTGTIEKIDLRSGEQTTLASVSQSNICGMIGEKLICRTWDMTEDYSLYFVDVDSGAVSHCGLVNKYNGWALEVMGETEEDAIVIYDYKADANSDGSYEIYQYKFALIDKDELYAGNGDYRPIQMVGMGR